MFRKLLGGLFQSGDRKPDQVAAAEAIEYREYQIVSQPESQGGQYRVSGVIRKPVADGEDREFRFERSDLCPSREACDALMVQKAQRFIDEMGDEMFATR